MASNGYLYRDDNDGSITRRVGNQNYTVFRNDPRYPGLTAELAWQNGGMAPGGTVNKPTGYDNVKSIQDEIKNAQTSAAYQQKNAAVDTLMKSIQGANRMYDQMAQEQYVAKRVAEQNIGQQLAASGLGTTGAAESTRLANESNYLNNLNQNETARQQAVAALEGQVAGQESGLANMLAEIQGNYGNNLTNAYSSFLGMDQNRALADREYRSQQEQLAYERQQQEQALRLDKLMQQMNMGYISPEARQYYDIPNEYAYLFNRNAMNGLSGLGKPRAGGGSGGQRSSVIDTDLGGVGDKGIVANEPRSGGSVSDSTKGIAQQATEAAMRMLAPSSTNRVDSQGYPALPFTGAMDVGMATRLYAEGKISEATYRKAIEDAGYGKML